MSRPIRQIARRVAKHFLRAEPRFFLVIWLFFMVGGRSRLFRDRGTFWHTAAGCHVISSLYLYNNLHKHVYIISLSLLQDDSSARRLFQFCVFALHAGIMPLSNTFSQRPDEVVERFRLSRGILDGRVFACRFCAEGCPRVRRP